MNLLDPKASVEQDESAAAEASTFGEILSQFERTRTLEPAAGASVRGVLVSITSDYAVVDIGRKREGVIPLAALRDASGALRVSCGDTLSVVVTGTNAEGYYELSPLEVKRPVDWQGLEKAFQEKAVIGGRVTELVKGGLRVDVGVTAFLPASRSGARDQQELEKLVGQEILCRITKLDASSEDVVVDRRCVLEEEAARRKEEAFARLVEGAVVHGVVRTLTEYGAFVDLGGVDGLLHVADMSWNRQVKPSDLLSVGDAVEVKVLKVDPASRRIALGMKQLSPDPFTLATRDLKVGERVKGKVTRLADFGAFVEIAPGVEGLIHISSLSWSRKVRKPSDVVQPGEVVEALVLDIKPEEKRISLGLKEALGDPWEEAETRFPPGSIVEQATVTNLAKFGAFVDLGAGLEGMIHISDITSEKRLNHPNEMLTAGQKVRAVVLEVDKEKRRIRLGLKQLEPTVTDRFIAGHAVGQTLSGRVLSVSGDTAQIELAEGVTGICQLPKPQTPAASQSEAKPDVRSLSAMLAQRWKQGALPANTAPRLRPGEVRTFKITGLDAKGPSITVELV